jgi:20S proteasome subunit beta 2
MLRNYLTPNERGEKERTYTFRRGTTAIKKEVHRNFEVTDEVVAPTVDAMDTT